MLIDQQSVYRDKSCIAFCYYKCNGIQTKLLDVLYVLLIRISAANMFKHSEV